MPSILNLTELTKKITSDQYDETHINALKQLYQKNLEDPYITSLMGMAYYNKGQFLNAKEPFERSFYFGNYAIEAAVNLAGCYLHLGEYQKLTTLFKQQEALGHDSPDLHMIKAQYYLLIGQYKKGFMLYELRFDDDYLSRQNTKTLEIMERLPFPALKKGIKPTEDKRKLLIMTEQGYGDIIMFLRFIPLIKRYGFEPALFNLKPALTDLLKSQDLQIPLLKIGDSLLNFDYYTSLLSLPAYLEIAQIPPPFPFKIQQKWTLQEKNNSKIGIVVSAQKRVSFTYYMRSLSFKKLWQGLKPAHRLGDFYNLQHGLSSEDQAFIDQTSIIDLGKKQHNFMDLAMQVKAMDCIIAVDTAIVHLSAAMGIPTIILLSNPAEWRYGLAEKSDWFPEHHLIRQVKLGDWDSVFPPTIEKLHKILA